MTSVPPPGDGRIDGEPHIYREVSAPGPMSDLRAVGILITQHVSSIRSLVHYADVVPAGHEWTIPLEMDCGFRGALVIRVDAIGDCERRPRPRAVPRDRNGRVP